MMTIFEELYDELSPFLAYRDHMYAEKKMCVVGSNKVKVMPLKLLREELFTPKDDTNKEMDDMSAVLGAVAAAAMLEELRNPKKAPFDCLSSAGGVHSWESSTDGEKDAGLCESAVNDASESTFGGFTQQIQNFSRMSITCAGAIEQACRNRVFPRGHKECADQ